MNMKKLAIAAAVSAAVGGATLPAQALVTGVPGEALLVPMVLSSDNAGANGTQIETFVGIGIPAAIGYDSVIEVLSAPNVTANKGPLPITQSSDNWEIHWTYFNQDSIKVQNDTCTVSQADGVLWSTDGAVRDQQVAARAALNLLGALVPDPVCGPTLTTRVGYVVFQTFNGSDGLDADFAMYGAAGIVGVAGLLSNAATMAGVPVLPLADGADTDPTETPLIGNEVINDTAYGDGDESDPVSVSPIFAGIRMNDAIDGAGTSRIRVEMPIQGPASGPVGGTTDDAGQSLHVFWFDNTRARNIPVEIFDEHETDCSYAVDLPHEVNLLLYNNFLTDETTGGWGTMASGFNNQAGAQQRGLTYVIEAFAANGNPGGDYDSDQFCAPDYWDGTTAGLQTYDGAMGGYVRYNIPEENENSALGGATSGMVAFSWQENNAVAPSAAPESTAWSSHLGIDLGIH